MNQIILKRSRANVAASVICSSKQSKRSKKKTKDPVVLRTVPSLWFLLGNLVWGGIPGWVVDGVTNSGWDYSEPVSLGGKCQS